MAAAGGAGVGDGVGDAGLLERRGLGRRVRVSRMRLRWRLRRWKRARRVRLRRLRQSRAGIVDRVKADGSGVVVSGADGSAAGVTGVDGISGWMRCESGLLLGERGLRRSTMR